MKITLDGKMQILHQYQSKYKVVYTIQDIYIYILFTFFYFLYCSEPIRVFQLQIAVLSTHFNGRDTHIRQIKVYSVPL